MYTFHLLEAERHLEFYVGGSIGIVCKFLMVMIAIFLIAQAKSLVPFQTRFLPFFEPFQFRTGTHEELHLHLLELTHTENELTCYNFVAESLANLRNTEGNAHTTRFLHIEVVHEDSLRRFRTQINRHGTVGGRTHLGLEHEVELTNIGPVLGSADWVNDFLVYYNLAKLLKVVGVHRIGKTLVQRIALGLVLHHARIGLTEKSLIEAIAETFGRLGNLFLYLIINFCNLLFNKHIGTVTLLRVAVVNQWVVECVDMA